MAIMYLCTEGKGEKEGVHSYVCSVYFAMNILKSIKCNESLDLLYCFCWTNATNNALETRKRSFSEFLHYLKQTIVFFLPQYSKETLTRELSSLLCLFCKNFTNSHFLVNVMIASKIHIPVVLDLRMVVLYA